MGDAVFTAPIDFFMDWLQCLAIKKILTLRPHRHRHKHWSFCWKLSWASFANKSILKMTKKQYRTKMIEDDKQWEINVREKKTAFTAAEFDQWNYNRCAEILPFPPFILSLFLCLRATSYSFRFSAQAYYLCKSFPDSLEFIF